MSGMKSTEAHRGHKLLLPSCRFQVVTSELSLHSRGTGLLVLQNGWMVGGGGGAGRANH